MTNMNRSPLGLLMRRAARQHGLVTQTDLDICGVSRAACRTAVDRGWLGRVAPGVYAVAGAPRTWFHHVQAATLLGGGAPAARATAVALHGFDDNMRRGRPHIVLPFGRRIGTGEVDVGVHHSRTLQSDDVLEVGGIACCTAERAVIDLGIDMGRSGRWIDVAAAAIRSGATDSSRLNAQLDRSGKVPHANAMRQALAALDPDTARTRSVKESSFLRALLTTGVPRPVVNYRVINQAGRQVAEIDLAWPQWLHGWEIDGFRWHSLPNQRLKDDLRDLTLAEQGWDIRRLSVALIDRNLRWAVGRVATGVQAAARRHGVELEIRAV